MAIKRDIYRVKKSLLQITLKYQYWIFSYRQIDAIKKYFWFDLFYFVTFTDERLIFLDVPYWKTPLQIQVIKYQLNIISYFGLATLVLILLGGEVIMKIIGIVLNID